MSELKPYRCSTIGVAAAIAAVDAAHWNENERKILKRIADGDRPGKEVLAKDHIGADFTVYEADKIKFCFHCSSKFVEIGRVWG